MMALLFLLGAALLGTQLVRRALGRLLNHAEQLCWGVVVGWMLSTLAAYGVARASGRLAAQPLTWLTIAINFGAALLWLPTLTRLRRDSTATLRELPRELWRRPRGTHYTGLLLTLALFAPVYARLFSTHMLEAGRDGIYSGGSAWYDLPFHLALSTSFLYGQNFPPIYTPFPPAPLLYPFMPDFLTAVLVALGMNLRTALLATSLPLAFIITALFYSLAERILRSFDLKRFDAQPAPATDTTETQTGDALQVETSDPSHDTEASSDTSLPSPSFIDRVQLSAVLATILFLLNGGLGFLYFFEDWRTSRKSFAAFWSHLEVNYANLGEKQIHWTSLISDTFLPQRASLFGIPAALMTFTLFACVWQRWTQRDAGSGWTERDARNSGESDARDAWDGWRLLLVAGVLVGLLPTFHTHTYMAAGLVSGFLFLLRPRRAWLAFWTPAVLLAVPHLLSLTGHVAAGNFMRFQPGWRGHSETSWLLYWLRNIGTPLLLIAPAWASAPRVWRRFSLAFAGLLTFSLLVVVSPNDYDNIKLMYYCYAVACILIAAWLVRLACVHRQRLLALLLVFTSIASALLALQFESINRKLLFSRDEQDAARYVAEHTAPRALFLTAPTSHQPVLSLAGRPVLRGGAAWLGTHGYEFQQREADVKAIYAGGDDALELLAYYRVAFVYLSQTERNSFPVNQRFFDDSFPVLYRNPSLVIYDTRAQAGEDGNPTRLPATTEPREFASRLDRDPYQLLVEFPRVAYAVYRFYRVGYGRMPRFAEFMEDMRVVGRGVYVSAPGWQQILEQNKLALTDEMTTRTEFKMLNDARSDEEYVAALYTHAGVKPSTRESEPLVSALRNRTETRASVLRRVAENRTLYRREYNSAYVLMHYFGYLRRNPDDPPDHNLEGFLFWVRDLDGAGDYRNLSGAFIGSGEYEARARAEFDARQRAAQAGEPPR